MTQSLLPSAACCAHWGSKGFTRSLLHNRSVFQLFLVGCCFALPLQNGGLSATQVGVTVSAVQCLHTSAAAWVNFSEGLYLINQEALKRAG